MNNGMNETVTRPEQPQCEASRSRCWSELSIEEKLERSRQVIQTKDLQLEHLENRLYRLERMFKAHGHKHGGEIIVSLHEAERVGDLVGLEKRLSNLSKDSREAWF